jgi:hypothetical protein
VKDDDTLGLELTPNTKKLEHLPKTESASESEPE